MSENNVIGLLARCSLAASALACGAGCGDDGPATRARPLESSALPSAGQANQLDSVEGASTGIVVSVAALDNSFRPLRLEVAVGDQVVWENRGANDHDVLSVDGGDATPEAWGVEVAEFGPGATYAHVFDEPGEYRYFCSIHGDEEVGMVGTVVVEP